LKYSLAVIIAVLCLGTYLPSFAQNAKDPGAKAILDGLYNKYSKMPAWEATYEHISETASGKVFSKQDGKILVAGKKYSIALPTFQIICDGKTIWTYNKEVNEVNISAYAPEDDEITPDQIFGLYRKGYKYILMGELKSKTGIVQTIDLEPEDITKEIVKVRLIINKADATLKKWMIYERGTSNRQIFVVKSFTPNANVASNRLVFNKTRFPGAKIVDLR